MTRPEARYSTVADTPLRLRVALAAGLALLGWTAWRVGTALHMVFAIQGERLRRRAWWGALPMLVLLAVPAGAQEPPEATEEDPFPVTAAAWCALKDRESAPVTPPEETGEKEAPVVVQEPPEPGCDLGVGMALYRRGKLSWVAVLGQETLGTGLAWVPHRPKRGPIPAIALGVVVPYDAEGIYLEPHLAIGATLAFTGRGK